MWVGPLSHGSGRAVSLLTLFSPVQLMRPLGPLMGNSSCYNSHELKGKSEQSQKNAKGRNAVPLTMVAVDHFLAAQDPPSSQILP